jgi:putative hydrolase
MAFPHRDAVRPRDGRHRVGADPRDAVHRRGCRSGAPLRLLSLAVELRCDFAIDADADAPGQPDWQAGGCERAVETGVPPESVINSLTAEALLDRSA